MTNPEDIFKPLTSGTDKRLFNFAERFNEILDVNTSQKQSEKMAFLEAANILKLYLKIRSEDLNEPQFEIDKFYALAEEILKSKSETYRERQRIGLIIHGLIVHGLSRLKAIDAVCYWFGISPTKAKDSHNQVRYNDWFKIKWKDKESFVDDTGIFLFQHLIEIEKPFPEQYEEAHIAYTNLIQSCTEQELLYREKTEDW